MSKLIILDGMCKGQAYILRSRNILGRHSDCSFIIKDKGISGKHCKIDQTSQRDYVITDLDSSNGTYINNKTIITERLKPGDIITLGKIRILFQTAGKIETESTIMLDMVEYLSEASELTHCGKPSAKEWTFCPYCGKKFKWVKD